MNTIQPSKPQSKRGNPILFLGCKLFGHKYRVTKKTSNIKEFQCINCKKEFTLDGYGHYTPLTPKLRDINKAHEKFYNSKR